MTSLYIENEAAVGPIRCAVVTNIAGNQGATLQGKTVNSIER